MRTLGRHPLTRRVDRVQAWAVAVGVVVLIVAAHHAAGYSHTAYAARAQSFAAEVASRHPVEATATSASTSVTKGPISAQTLAYHDHVQWFANDAHARPGGEDRPPGEGR